MHSTVAIMFLSAVEKLEQDVSNEQMRQALLDELSKTKNPESRYKKLKELEVQFRTFCSTVKLEPFPIVASTAIMYLNWLEKVRVIDCYCCACDA